MKAVLVAAILLIAVAGCGGKKTIGPNPGPTYAVPSTPQVVLSNLGLSYSNRDSTEYKALFDDAYLGTSLDQTDPGAVIDSLYKSDESRHISAMARSTTISSVILELTPNFTRSRDAADPPGWALIENPVFRLEIYDGFTQYILSLHDEVMEFRFVPTTPAAGSPTDTTWKIIRWTEVRN